MGRSPTDMTKKVYQRLSDQDSSLMSHLCSKDRVLSGGNDALLRPKTEMFSTTRDRQSNFEVSKGLSVLDDLLGNLFCKIGSVLSPTQQHWKSPLTSQGIPHGGV